MPRGDGTGPMGMGSMTGRGAGYCSGKVTPGFANCLGGFGRGLGAGRGYRRMFYATGVPGVLRNPVNNGQIYDEKAVLENQEENLEAQLKLVKERLKNFKEQK
ncbi:DUF5320 domain-containing protein [Acetivibrio cellulolyticus]|uniref:DUF5320 domain-containing protein n=1 Tax=Acetivibrio cellulolyticus TaxID=35830 RepID=UPI0001E2CCA8|nr:DUF5320 domain-containing protein [Acetivibrio cellulolyticus]